MYEHLELQMKISNEKLEDKLDALQNQSRQPTFRKCHLAGLREQSL